MGIVPLPGGARGPGHATAAGSGHPGRSLVVASPFGREATGALGARSSMGERGESTADVPGGPDPSRDIGFDGAQQRPGSNARGSCARSLMGRWAKGRRCASASPSPLPGGGPGRPACAEDPTGEVPWGPRAMPGSCRTATTRQILVSPWSCRPLWSLWASSRGGGGGFASPEARSNVHLIGTLSPTPVSSPYPLDPGLGSRDGRLGKGGRRSPASWSVGPMAFLGWQALGVALCATGLSADAGVSLPSGRGIGFPPRSSGTAVRPRSFWPPRREMRRSIVSPGPRPAADLGRRLGRPPRPGLRPG
jgi:hypothetical protein